MLPNNIKQFSGRPRFAFQKMMMQARSLAYSVHKIQQLNADKVAIFVQGTLDLEYDYTNGVIPRNSYVTIDSATDAANNGTFRVVGVYTSTNANESYLTIENPYAIEQAAASGTIKLNEDSYIPRVELAPFKAPLIGNTYFSKKNIHSNNIYIYNKEGYFLLEKGRNDLALQISVYDGTSITVDIKTSVDSVNWVSLKTAKEDIVITDTELFLLDESYPSNMYFLVDVKTITGDAEYSVLTLGD